jgi:uncharacterized membrane protein
MNLATVNSAAHFAEQQQTSNAGPQWDVLAAAACVVVAIGLICWIGHRDVTSAVAVAGVCMGWLAMYMFFEMAWPMGVIASIWAAIVLWKWQRLTRPNRAEGPSWRRTAFVRERVAKERFGRLFGTNSVN